jgi:hypothetical protein
MSSKIKTTKKLRNTTVKIIVAENIVSIPVVDVPMLIPIIKSVRDKSYFEIEFYD